MSTQARLETRPAPAFPPAISLIGHIMARDLRRLWPVVLLWLVMLLDVALVRSGRGPNVLALLPMRLLGFYLLPALVILQDPLAGPAPFWRTRPIPLRLLLAARYLFILVVVVLPSLAAEAFRAAQSGAALAWQPAVVGLSALWLLVTILIVTVAAAACGSLARFTAFLLATWVAMLIVSSALYAILFRDYLADPGALPTGWLGPTLVLLGLAIGAGILALVGLTRGRSLWLPRALVTPPLLALVMITPGENLLMSELSVLAQRGPAPGLDVSIDSIRPAPARGRGACDIAFLTTPHEPRQAVGSIRVIRRRDGVPPRRSERWAQPTVGTGLTPQLMAPSLESGNPGFPASKGFWNLTPAEPGEAATGGRLDFDAEFTLQEVTLVTLPLAAGARVDHGDTSYRIQSLTFADGRVELTATVTSLRAGFGERTGDAFLVHRGRREVVLFNSFSSGSSGDPDLPIPWPRLQAREISASTEGALPGWVDGDEAPSTGPFRWKRGPLSHEWLRGAELAVVERVHRGLVTRSFRGVLVDSTGAGGEPPAPPVTAPRAGPGPAN